MRRSPEVQMQDSRFLAQILTGGNRKIYLATAALWGVAALFFWHWWFKPAHNIDTLRYAIATLCMAWLYFLQAYFIVVFLAARRSVAPDPQPGQYRVAMVVTKTPAEPFAVLKKTLTAMLGQTYTHDTWLADEDPAPETVAWCRDHGVQISTRKDIAAYHQTTWPRRTRCKEGNLAYFYDHYGYEAYDIVAQLDADHVPEPGYLREMLRPFADPGVGYVSAPSICNANAGRSWAARTRLHAEAVFHGLLQSGYTGLLSPLCIGSHYAVRTQALREIGGLGPDLAEDHSTTLLMCAGGWRGVHALDAIAYGDGPANVADLATQELQWSRSLLTVFLSHTPRYLGRLPARLRFLFAFSQLWYPVFAVQMLVLYLVPIYALSFDQRFADVSYPAFFGHALPSVVVMTLMVFKMRRDRLFRPLDSKVISWEKFLFVFVQWPWVLWGCILAIRDRVTGRFVDFRVTPKGDAASRRLPSRVVAVYVSLALGAILPVILMGGARDAGGFYLLSGLNAVIYSGIVLSIVIRHLRDNAQELKSRTHALVFQVGSAASLAALVVVAIGARGTESLFALSIGLEPFRIARVEYSVSGAGMDDGQRMFYRFDPGWN